MNNFYSGPDWVPVEIIQSLGLLTYLVDVGNSQFWKCHLDHLKDYTPKHPPLAHHTEPDSERDVDISPFAESGSV